MPGRIEGVPSFNQLVSRRAHGASIETGPDINGEINQDTLQCPHCGMHWVPQPGSGRRRGYCFKCSGVLCGRGKCAAECIPQEAQVELIEAGMHWDQLIEHVRFHGWKPRR